MPELPSRRTLVSKQNNMRPRKAFHLMVTSLPDSGYKLSAPLSIVIEQTSNTAIASFEAANIHMSGDTVREALDNLLSLMLDLFETFSSDETNLGKEPARQLNVLRSYIYA